MVVTRTLSKSYSWPGCVLVWPLPGLTSSLHWIKFATTTTLTAWPRPRSAAALIDQDYFRDSVKRICATRQWFSTELGKLGYRVIPSSANYLFASPPDQNGKRVYDALYQRKILVRYFSDPVLAHGLRISIGTHEEMERTLEALAEIG